jgi:hypothetical protein
VIYLRTGVYMKILTALIAIAAITFAGCSDSEGSTDQIIHDCFEADGSVDSGSPPTTTRVDSSTDYCVTAANCVIPTGPCITCVDGGVSCPTAECVEGVCIVTTPMSCDDNADAGFDAAVE